MNTIVNTLLPKFEAIEVENLSVSKITNLYESQFGYKANRHFTNLTNVSIYKCAKTGFRFYYPLLIEGDNEFYTELYTKHHDALYSKDKWEFRKAIELIDNGMKVLDIGSGGGDFLNNVRAQKHADVYALEKSSYACKLLKEKNIPFFPQTLEDFANTTTERFDVVSAFQVLEHVSEPGAFLNAATKLLKPNGKLIIGVPNSNPYLYKKDLYHTLNLPPHHMGLWDKEALKNLAPYFNLENKQVYIEPLDNVLFYLMTQVGIQSLYWKMQSNKLSYFLLKCIKQPLQLTKGLFEGRGLLAIYEPKA
jgi:2-polyprenyl-3-methyl-5-hydroxy-6-metoxy-1,4-benzoquinol methylase